MRRQADLSPRCRPKSAKRVSSSMRTMGEAHGVSARGARFLTCGCCCCRTSVHSVAMSFGPDAARPQEDTVISAVVSISKREHTPYSILRFLHLTSMLTTRRKGETAMVESKRSCEQKKAPFSISTQARLSERGPLPSACFGVYVHLTPLSAQPNVSFKLLCHSLIITMFLSSHSLLYAVPAASALWSSSLA
jgi:hypothetical protein